MNKKRQNFLLISLIKLLILLFLLFSNQTSLAQSSTDRRFPKDIAKVSLPKLLDFGSGYLHPL